MRITIRRKRFRAVSTLRACTIITVGEWFWNRKRKWRRWNTFFKFSLQRWTICRFACAARSFLVFSRKSIFNRKRRTTFNKFFFQSAFPESYFANESRFFERRSARYRLGKQLPYCFSEVSQVVTPRGKLVQQRGYVFFFFASSGETPPLPIGHVPDVKLQCSQFYKTTRVYVQFYKIILGIRLFKARLSRREKSVLF